MEAWTIKKSMLSKLNAFEMWHYRKMLKVLWTDMLSSTTILQQLNKELELEITIKKQKLAYLGHVLRNRKYDLLQVIIDGNVTGKRGRG